MEVFASLILVFHLAWILWVIFGALWTSGRALLSVFHVLSLLWGIAVEIGPWACPLTVVEAYFERNAGQNANPGGFLVHYLDSLVYPNISESVLVVAGVSVCALNLAIYIRRYWVAPRAP